MSTVAYPTGDSIIIIKSANTPEYENIPGVLINPLLSTAVLQAPAKHRKIVDGFVVLKTAEEILAMDTRTPAEKRADAYKIECDPYLPTLTSYFITNDERYGTLKSEWEVKRNDIKARYPDEV